MSSSFPLTKEDIINADKFDNEKHCAINEYLIGFFEDKKTALEKHIGLTYCFDHKMEKFTISDYHSTGMYGFGGDETFGGWEMSFSLHWNAKFNCGQKFQIGFYLNFQHKNLVDIIMKLSELSDSEIVTDQKFDDKNKLTVHTGFRKHQTV